ncbi:fibrinogen C domain-containing protein 1 [Elysia marginata]|uniref:Fibrinogen C domain-containing protein 1 n=1 Tax=Elysia marginata TaxID=1093978 RepID=A0AAV4J541_9GAST|nr:fibrinogen C domain-containing protein 1 [Elysia marginata]
MGAPSPWVLWLTAFITLSSSATGLEFTFVRNKWSLPAVNSACGTLLCQENVQASTDNNIHTITKMALLKTARPEYSNGGSRQLIQLATVTSAQPKLEQVFDGIRVDGRWEGGKAASLRVELSKQMDCRAEYTCQVQGVDPQGKELVTYFSLLQQPDQVVTRLDETGLTSSLVTQLLSIVQKQEVKLAIIEKTAERLEEKMNAAESSWRSHADDLSKQYYEDARSHESTLLEKLVSMEQTFSEKLNFLEHSLQDKSLMSFQSIGDRLSLLDSKLSAVDSEAIQDKVLKAMKHQTDEYILNFANISDRTNDELSKTTSLLADINSKTIGFEQKVLENHQEVLANMTRDVNELFIRNQNVTNKEGYNLVSSLKERVDLGLQNLEADINTYTVQTSNSFYSIISELNATLVRDVGSVLTDFFMPESCQRNTPVRLHPPSTPYPVIYRNEFPGLDTPLLCDTITDGGGWIVIQRRSTGNVDFYRNWMSYKNGFGTLDDDFWLGNEKIHAITSKRKYELRVDLRFEGQSKFALYDNFSLGDEDSKYVLHVGTYSGTAGDSLTRHNGHKFSTFDKDNDIHPNSCAKMFTGAWWYDRCHSSNLNGKWRGGPHKGLKWGTFTGIESVYFSEMKIRRVDP